MTADGISLIIPVYNASRYLAEALDSALNQTARPRQIIVVDDGSTDDSQEIARGYGDPVIVVAQTNGGTAAARNRGMQEVTQPLISFLDADDRLAPNKLERQLQMLSQCPEAMLCVCQVRDFWCSSVPEGARSAANLTPQFRLGQVTTWLARREVFDRAGVFDPSPDFRFSEGAEIYSRIESAGVPIVRTDDVLVERRLHTSNKSITSKRHLDGVMALMKRRMELRRKSA